MRVRLLRYQRSILLLFDPLKDFEIGAKFDEI